MSLSHLLLLLLSEDLLGLNLIVAVASESQSASIISKLVLDGTGHVLCQIFLLTLL